MMKALISILWVIYEQSMTVLLNKQWTSEKGEIPVVKMNFKIDKQVDY